MDELCLAAATTTLRMSLSSVLLFLAPKREPKKYR